jgi:hypothetical protein
MAILSDDLAKRQLHQRDFRRACFQRAIWPLQTLLLRDSYPPTSGFPTLYAQSASLTAFLVNRGSPSQFVRFVKQATYCGYDRALREAYNIEGIGELEKLWRYDTAHNARLEDGLCRGK